MNVLIEYTIPMSKISKYNNYLKCKQIETSRFSALSILKNSQQINLKNKSNPQ